MISSAQGTASRNFSYDDKGRLSGTVLKRDGSNALTTAYSYNSGTTQVTSITFTNLGGSVGKLKYSYDNNGNISGVRTETASGNYNTRYSYDTSNQLVREDNQRSYLTTLWTYDDAGNITSRKEYMYTTGTPTELMDTVNYTYGDDKGWGDLLTAYDGQTITYDNIGNPTSYYNGKRWNMTWTRGRQLETISDGTTTWTNTYSSDGLRTSRTDGSTTYTYVYDGDRLTGIQRNDLNMYIIYDANGPATIRYGTGTFHYVTNQQGDVVAIVGASGQLLVEYTYDAWGNVLSITGDYAYNLGIHNPILYRGYIYDHETGLYYVSSRYYDPEIGRFINADALVSTGQGLLGNNMFAYCVNNPVNMIDPTGQCSYFLFFKKDCFTATCPDSQCYNPEAPNVVVIYDGRFSGTIFRESDHGFEHQASELCRRLNATSAVTSHSYTTVDEFIDLWNGLDGNYDTIYIVGHSIAGELRFKGNQSIAAQGGTYSFSDLNSISVDSIYLYTCNGATIDGKKGSVAMHLADITGANVHAIKDGKLNLTWYGCFPIPKKGGYWVTVS